MNSFYKVITKPLFLIIIFNILVVPFDCEASGKQTRKSSFQYKLEKLRKRFFKTKPPKQQGLELAAAEHVGHLGIGQTAHLMPLPLQAQHEAPPPPLVQAEVHLPNPAVDVPDQVPVQVAAGTQDRGNNPEVSASRPRSNSNPIGQPELLESASPSSREMQAIIGQALPEGSQTVQDVTDQVRPSEIAGDRVQALVHGTTEIPVSSSSSSISSSISANSSSDPNASPAFPLRSNASHNFSPGDGGAGDGGAFQERNNNAVEYASSSLVEAVSPVSASPRSRSIAGSVSSMLGSIRNSAAELAPLAFNPLGVTFLSSKGGSGPVSGQPLDRMSPGDGSRHLGLGAPLSGAADMLRPLGPPDSDVLGHANSFNLSSSNGDFIPSDGSPGEQFGASPSGERAPSPSNSNGSPDHSPDSGVREDVPGQPAHPQAQGENQNEHNARPQVRLEEAPAPGASPSVPEAGGQAQHVVEPMRSLQVEEVPGQQVPIHHVPTPSPVAEDRAQRAVEPLAGVEGRDQRALGQQGSIRRANSSPILYTAQNRQIVSTIHRSNSVLGQGALGHHHTPPRGGAADPAERAGPPPVVPEGRAGHEAPPPVVAGAENQQVIPEAAGPGRRNSPLRQRQNRGNQFLAPGHVRAEIVEEAQQVLGQQDRFDAILDRIMANRLDIPDMVSGGGGNSPSPLGLPSDGEEDSYDDSSLSNDHKGSAEIKEPVEPKVSQGEALISKVSDSTPKIAAKLQEPVVSTVPVGQTLISRVSNGNPIDSAEIKEPVVSTLPQGQALTSRVSSNYPIGSDEIKEPAVFGVPKGQALISKVSGNTPKISAELQEPVAFGVPKGQALTSRVSGSTPKISTELQEPDAFAVPKGLQSTIVSGDSSKGGGDVLPESTNINSINQFSTDIQNFLSKILDLNRYIAYPVHQFLTGRVNLKIIATGDETKIEKGIWIKSIVANAKEQKSVDSPGYNSKSHGFVLGADAEFDSDILLGGAVSNIVSTLKLKDGYSGNKISANSKFGSLYGTKNLTNNIYISSVVSLMQSDIKSSYQGTDYKGKESATYHTQENVRGGYIDVKLHYIKKFKNKMVLIPFVGVNYYKNVLPGFSATDIKGSAFTVSSLHDQRTSVMVGTSLSTMPFFIRKLEVVPQINILIDRQIYSRTGSTKITNTNGSVVQDKIKNNYKTTFSLGGSLDVNYHNTNFLIAYDVLVRRKFLGQQVALKARLNF